MGSIIHFVISPLEEAWWQIDYADFLENEGPNITVDAISFVVTQGHVAVDTTSLQPHSPQIGVTYCLFWADALLSPLGEISIIEVTLTLSNGEELPRIVQFQTRLQ